MSHMTSIPILKGYGCQLRPVGIDDAEFIVNLRNQPFAKGTIHETSTSVEAQKAWISSWQTRENDYYWIIEDERLAKRIGTIGFYDIDLVNNEGMPGRWVMLPQANINIMAPVFLMYEYIFESLKIARIIIDVVATNKKVLRFHKLYGATQIETPTKYLGVASELGLPMVWFELKSSQWSEIAARWKPILEAF